MGDWFYNAIMHPNDADEMGNSVEPDLLEQSDLSLHCLLRSICPDT